MTGEKTVESVPPTLIINVPTTMLF